MTHLGIVVAMTGEALSLTRQDITHGQSFRVQEGPWVQVSGIGSNRAAVAARELLHKDVKALVSWGIAGGLIPGPKPGALILPRSVLAANGLVYLADPDWHERLCKRLGPHFDLYTEPLAESATVLTIPSQKVALFERTAAIAVDMESAAVAAVAHEEGVPFVAIRAIADPGGKTIPQGILNALDDFGRLRPFRLLKELTRHPMDLIDLVRLRGYFRAAQASLVAAVHLTGGNLLFRE